MRVLFYRFVEWIYGLTESVIVVRMIMRFFSASPAAPAVSFVYRLTDWLLHPVNFIFPNVVVGTGVFDVVALVGLVFYAVIFLVILRLVRFFLIGPAKFY
jgi:hypothetical protein